MFGKKAAGIFLGPKGVSIVEMAGLGKVKNYIFNPYPRDITKPTGGVTPTDNIFEVFLDNEVEILAFLQRSIRESRVDIENFDVVICIPNRDLIVRFFEIPSIPRKDIAASIGFEIKKYIPFRTEEITYDYQTHSQRNIIEVLFAGIKNEDLKKYNSILTQLKVNILAVEPSQFSLLRLLKIKKIITPKEAVVVVELEGTEGSILIVDNGIPCFSRDIKISSGPETTTDTETISFRIINEVRVSVDYFRRQFLKKGVERIIILSKEESKELINAFNKELGIRVIYQTPDNIFGIKDEYSLNLAKALGGSLRISNPSLLLINLGKKQKLPALSLKTSPQMILDSLGEILDIPKATIIKSIIFVLLVLSTIWAVGIYKMKPIQNKLDLITKEASSLITGNLTSMDSVTMNSLKDDFVNKLNIIGKVFKKDYFISEKLEVLPGLLPEGAWLEEISFDRDQKFIYLRGIVYKDDEKEAADAPYNFVSNLKNSPLFSNKVKFIQVKSLRSDILNNYKVIRFEINISLT